MRVIDNVEQGSAEWLRLRLGKITASRAKDIMTKGKGETFGKTAYSYMNELIAEILTGDVLESYQSSAMQWGNDVEPQARAMYEIKEGVDVIEVAFIEHSDFCGVSPDGLVGDDGLLEIKCPNTKTQIQRALSNCYHEDYKYQIQMQLLVSDRKWCDFLSFDPRIDGKSSYLLERVYRDEDIINDMDKRIDDFISEMIDKLVELK